ncbi:MAG: STAS domain-containing protein [Acidobacteriota bacterium]
MISQTELESAVKAEGETAVVYAGDYLNKITGEQIERECKRRLSDGCKKLIVNFSQTEIVNSIGVSILLGVIDSASNTGARVVFTDVKDETAELFDMLGLTRHVTLEKNKPAPLTAETLSAG